MKTHSSVLQLLCVDRLIHTVKLMSVFLQLAIHGLFPELFDGF